MIGASIIMINNLRELSSKVSDIKSFTKIIKYTYDYSLDNDLYCPDISLILKIILENLSECEDNLDKMFYDLCLKNQKN